MDHSMDTSPFAALGVPAALCRAVEALGFVRPMPIQEAVIPYLLQHDGDLIALAQTGTGKTAAYGLPLIVDVEPHRKDIQAVVLCPTRELCLQITDDLRAFATHSKGIHIAAIYGGASVQAQQDMLRKGVQVVVATPGRLIDLIHRGSVKLSAVHTLILDEADEMLNMGFKEALDEILAFMPSDRRRTLLFSATMSREIEQIARTYLHEPKEIVAGSRNEGAENVNHHYYMVQAKDKYAALKRIVDYYPRIYGIIFCRTKVETQEVADRLIRDGYNAEALHGDLAQQQRDLTMQKFRSHLTQLLVATDVAARGLDVNDLTHVIHYGLPGDTESYTHRSGRTGRAGKNGISIAIIHLREQHRINDIERTIGKNFVRQHLPTAKDICTKQLYRVIEQIERTEVNEADIAPFMADLQRRFDYMDKQLLIQKVVAREFGKFLDYYAKAPDIEEPQPSGKNPYDRKEPKEKEGSVRHSRKPQKGYRQLRINAGKKDGFYPGVVMQFINRYIPGRQNVGHIELTDRHALVEVPQQDAHRVVKALNGRWFKNKEVSVKMI